MFQAYLSAELVSPPALQIKDGPPLYSKLYNEQVKDAVAANLFSRNDDSGKFGELIPHCSER